MKDYNAGYVIMHMEGDPDNMQKKPTYNNVVDSIYTFNSKINQPREYQHKKYNY